MNLNKNFLTEVIKYLISKGVTVHDVLDAFHAEFECREQLINRQDEIRKGEELHLLLCGKSVEESSTPCATVDSNRDLCQKVEKNAENTKKPVNKSLIDYPKNPKNHGNGVSPARKALFDVINGKTVIEHLKENGITYSNFDNRIRKKWSVAEACTTPLASWGKGKRKRVIEEPEEPEETKAVIIPDSVKVVEESSTPEKPTETLETESNTEKPTESVTNATELNGNNVTAVILDTPNPDAIREDKNDYIEKALKKFVTHTEESKKPKEIKADLTVLEVCQKINVTTHELKEMIATGEFPQPDRGNKWSAKLLKDKGII